MFKTWSDAIITFTANVSDYLGPVAKMIDTVMDRVVSIQTAQACSNGWPICSSECVFAYCGSGDTLLIITYGLNCSPQGVKCAYDYCGAC